MVCDDGGFQCIEASFIKRISRGIRLFASLEMVDIALMNYLVK